MKAGSLRSFSVALVFFLMCLPMAALGAIELKENAAGPLQSSSKPPVASCGW